MYDWPAQICGIIWRHPDSFELNSIAVTSHTTHIRYDWRKRIAKYSEVFWKEKSRSSENGGRRTVELSFFAVEHSNYSGEVHPSCGVECSWQFFWKIWNVETNWNIYSKSNLSVTRGFWPVLIVFVNCCRRLGYCANRTLATELC